MWNRIVVRSKKIWRFLLAVFKSYVEHECPKQAASLAYYQDTQFEFPDPVTASVDDQTKAFQKRMKFLLALPTPVTMKLIEAVNKFDQDMTVIFAEGAPEDF